MKFFETETRRIYLILIEQYNWSIKKKAQNSRMYVLSESIKIKIIQLKRKCTEAASAVKQF